MSDEPLRQFTTGRARYDWLRKQKLMQEYDRYLENRIAELSAWLRTELHKINPNLLLCVYVLEIGNWFCRGLARGLGTPEMPVLNFAEHTYYGVGYDPEYIHAQIERFRSWGAYVFPAFAIWTLFFPPTESHFLAAHCYNLALHAGGYWVWPGDAFVRYPCDNFSYFGKPSLTEDLWLEVRHTNDELDHRLRIGKDYKSALDDARPVPWRGKWRRGKWDVPSEVISRSDVHYMPIRIAAPCRLFFTIPHRSRTFTITVYAPEDGNGAHVAIVAPDGTIVAEVDGEINAPTALRTNVTNAMRSGEQVWQLIINHARNGIKLNELRIDVEGIPPYLSPNPDAILTQEMKPPGLIAWWRFDEGKGTLVRDSSSPPPCDGQVNGARWVQGKIGMALEFDGKATFVRVPVTSEFHNLMEFTVTAWIKLNALP
ncbi:MAG TPA: hypothetical protein EYP10_05035, partial [Armatimonadetes bacterium]|nr:hypothetical protein [Armatimonadota bacterium]